jgi:DNA excision repair protein ERCC-3
MSPAQRLASDHGIDLTDLRKGVYAVSIEDVLQKLECRGTVTEVNRVRAPLFTPRSELVRAYQWTCVAKMHRRSGFVVAPCGCGKTLMGLLVAVLNGGRFLVLTTRYAQQWKSALDLFFEPLRSVCVVAGNQRDGRGLPDVVISTYSTFVKLTRHSRLVRQLVYDTVILDEAHGAASASVLALIDRMHVQYWCALTATKVREDEELTKLEARVGGTVVELDRGYLVENGHIADVDVSNILVPYADECGLEKEIGRVMALALHSNKMQVLLAVLRRLTAEEYKTIVFCDDLFCLDWAAAIVRAAALPLVGQISMRTPFEDRTRLVDAFTTSKTALLFVSRTGDEALDIPAASAGVVFWNHWASRRQIVQRIGRLSRVGEGAKPCFIVLLADDDRERRASAHRDLYLQQHGYVIRSTLFEQSRFFEPLLTGGRYV